MAIMAPATVDFDPVTRVAGGLAFHTVLDFDSGRVTEAAASGTLFRGYEVLLEGRDARDGIFVSSRVCGACGGAHATASSLAFEMACGIAPPPFGVAVRNTLAALEDLYDMPTALFVRAGPDYSEPVVRETSPELWERAQAAPAPGAATHGYARIADLMSAITRMHGELYVEALTMARKAREAYVLSGGKYPHPQTTVPGGISSTVDPSDLNLTLLRITKFFDYGRKVAAVWDDLADFFLEAEPRFAEVGAGPANFIDYGRWDDPYLYDGTHANAGDWGAHRWASPGVVTDGRLQTTDLRDIDLGVEEFVDHSFYENWSGVAGTNRSPGGRDVPRNHPLNKATLPQPANADWRGKYSWVTAPRWNGQPMETGMHASMCITALAAGPHQHRRFMEPTGRSLKMTVPQGEMRSTEIEWHVPRAWNALERHRARAYGLVHSALVAYENILMAYDLKRQGGPDSGIFEHYKIPKDERVGIGFWGSGRGGISHHVVIDGRVIRRYQVVGGSTWNASPRDAFGTPGPCEQAVLGTPLLSSQHRERGLDVLRAIRSYDPCMACAAQ